MLVLTEFFFPQCLFCLLTNKRKRIQPPLHLHLLYLFLGGIFSANF